MTQENYFVDLVGEWYDYDTGTSFEIRPDGRVLSEDAVGLRGQIRQSTDYTDFSVFSENGACAYKVKVVVPRKELGWSLRSGPEACPKLRHVSRLERSKDKASIDSSTQSEKPRKEKKEPPEIEDEPSLDFVPAKPSLKSGDYHGWSYFGVRRNGQWKERSFIIGNNIDAIPRKNDVIVALGFVNIRKGPIELVGDDWVNQSTVRLGRPGDKFRIGSVKQVFPGFYWVEIDNIVDSK